MPAHHHRTVDRIVAILEEAARATTGVPLGELARRLEAPKSSIQELTNGLLASGYLVETDGRFLLGPAAFVLSLYTAGFSLRRIEHEQLEIAQARVGVPLFVGIRVGDDQVWVDRVGEDLLMDYTWRNHPRRPLLTGATGKIILANLHTAERNDFLHRMAQTEPENVATFLEELNEIRATRLAYNYGGTFPNRFAVATPLIGPDGVFLAAIGAAGDEGIADRLPEVGARLLEAVRCWKFGRRRPR